MASTVLITGSEGNIGRYVLSSLAREVPDARIIRVARQNGSDADLYGGDLQDSSFVRRIFAENAIDTVIHLAARRYSASAFKKESYDLFHNDLACLLNVVEASRHVRKFVYVSSALVYESGTESPFTEDMTERIPPPRSPLGMAKLAGERAVRLLTEQYGISHTIWRPFNVVSPLEPHTNDGHVFVDFYRRLFVEKVPVLDIFGSGKQVRCFAWVEDITNAVAKYLFDERTDDQIFNIGSTEQTTLRELADLMLALGHEKGFLPASYAPEITTGSAFAGTDSEVRVPSLEKIERDLFWKPRTDLRSCFSAFIEHKQQHED